jgi:hypothetical protein
MRNVTKPWFALALVSLWLLALGLLGAMPLHAQDPVPAPIVTGGPRVFFDCQGGPHCDLNFHRTEIPWVTWVRDQADAQLHVIVTNENTGAGGRAYQMDFIGRAPYEAYLDEVTFQSLPTDTESERLDAVSYALAVGFARFAQHAGFRELVVIEADEGYLDGGDLPTQPQGIVAQEEVQDPWNLWVFRINGNGNLNGESNQKNRSFNGGFNASRVTPTWRQNYGMNVNYNFQERELSSGGTFTDERTNWNVNTTVVYSIAEHWSAGLTSRVGRDVRQNQKQAINLNPAIEYSFFPYEEATRRSLTAFYEIGPEYYDYYEVNQDSLLTETRGRQRLTLEFSQRQTWGDASVVVSGSHYLHDLDRYNLEVRGDLSFRVTRGLNVNFGGNYTFVADQLYLPYEEPTDEEILTGVRRIATDKEYGLFIGMSYQFGSIFNNVVNNRFPGGGGPGGGGGGGNFGGGGGGGGGG